jgi:acyl-CoA dehydrogenase
MVYTEQHTQMQDALKRFIDAEINPHVDEWERDGIFPARELFRKMGRLGFLGTTKPVEYGGLGLDYSYSVALAETLGHIHCGGVPMAIGVQTDMATPALARFGSEEIKREFLAPSISGDYVACLGVSEVGAGSDVASIRTVARKDGDDYVIDGGKMWTTNGTQADWMCLLANTSDGAPHRNKTLICVPMDTPGVRVIRSLPVFGYYGVPDRASEVVFENVVVPASNMLLGEGRGFEIAQGRLGPGRIHHCMRAIGMAERMLEAMIDRALQRTAFGKTVAEQGVTRERIANARILIDQSRLLTLHAAHKMDTVGNKAALAEIAMIKIAVPNMLCQVTDWAIQVFGGGGTGNDFGTAIAYAIARVLRLADGPDEVHRDQLARLEIAKRKGRNHPGWERMVTSRGLPPRAAE